MPRLIDADSLADRLDALAYDDWNQGTSVSWADAFKVFAEMVRDEFCSRGEEKEDEEEPITPEMFADKMRGIANRYYGDEEMGHIQADGLMIVLLEQLGYKEGAEIFENMAKWYS